jgi:hypothetical protein
VWWKRSWAWFAAALVLIVDDWWDAAEPLMTLPHADVKAAGVGGNRILDDLRILDFCLGSPR